ncbi:hypothetical protein [Halorubrum ezzemoulense]|nr:hypothetical protein [Halorubrum ezzemoulense]
MDDTTNDVDDEEHRTSMVQACIKGREETHERLRELGFSDDDIDTMERHHGHVELARGVADGLRWARQQEQQSPTLIDDRS